jgi:hypothetical protein
LAVLRRGRPQRTVDGMYTLKGYPVDIEARRRLTRERAERRRARVAAFKRLLRRSALQTA